MSGQRLLRRYRVEGRVQGVGFRYFVLRQAQQLGVRGWVCNRLDGSVEVLAEGSELVHGQLLDGLRTGPRWSKVTRVSWADEHGARQLAPEFEIRRDR